MKTVKIRKYTLGVLRKLSQVLPVFFWGFLIFSFEEPMLAIITIVAAIVHEGGHIFCILWQRGKINLRGVLSGFRIKSGGVTTYRGEILTYLSGPLANLILATLSALFIPTCGDVAAYISLTNFATALSNLLPIKGYDGYGILRAVLQKYELSERVLHLSECLSGGATFLFCLISLYLIDRIGGGYWIFAVFFFSMIGCINDDINRRFSHDLSDKRLILGAKSKKR